MSVAVRTVVLADRAAEILGAFPMLAGIVASTEAELSAAGRDFLGVRLPERFQLYRTALFRDELWDGTGTVTEYDDDGQPVGYAGWQDYLSDTLRFAAGSYVSWELRDRSVATVRVCSVGRDGASLMATDGFTEFFPNGIPESARLATVEEAESFEAIRGGRVAPVAYE